MCYRKSPCPSLRLATTPCNSCTKANIPMPISQVPTSTAESTASYGKLRCDKHNRDGDIMFTSWDMYGYVILRYNGDTMRIYTVDICWLWLWSALARYGMYVYIYIQYSQRVDQNSNSQYGKLWLTIKFGGALLLVCLENGEWTPQLRVFFTGNMASVNWASTPLTNWSRKSPGIIIPFLTGWTNHTTSQNGSGHV